MFRRPLIAWAAFTLLVPAAVAQEPIRLQEEIRPGQQFQISVRTELTGRITLAAELAKDKKTGELALTGGSTIDHVEKVLAFDPATQTGRVVRLYRTIDFKRKVNDEALENSLRPGVRRTAVVRSERTKTAFSPDGPLTFAEIDMLRGDVFTPALVGLLPAQPVKPGDTWKAAVAAVRELADLEQITAGSLDCVFQEVVTRAEGRFALVRFKGDIQGVGLDGPNRQRLEGYFHFDLGTNRVSHLFFNGTSWLPDRDGKPGGKIEGRFILNRKPIEAAELSDQALQGVVLEPNFDNTRMLFTEPTLGVEMTFPRHWTMRQADAKQIVLDEPNGNGLLITLEPADRTPSAEQYKTEVEAWIAKEQIKLLRTDPVQRLQAGVDTVDRFAFEAEIKGQRCVLDYFVVRQAAAGATCAGRWDINAAPTLHAEAERIVKSLKLTKPQR